MSLGSDYIHKIISGSIETTMPVFIPGYKELAFNLYFTSKDDAIISDVTVKSNLGDLTFKDISGIKNEHITLNIPKKAGYVADKKTVEAIVNTDGTISTNDSVTYTKDDSGTITPPVGETVISNVTIKSNLGDVVVKDASGVVGQIISVNVPEKSGYGVDKKTINATVNDDKTITPNESVTYTKDEYGSDSSKNDGSNEKPTNHNGENSYNNTHGAIVKENNLLATHLDQSYYTLYSFNAGKMSPSKTRSLSKGSDWRSDQRITVNGQTYFRVATNEWVKANSVYPYIQNSQVVTVKNFDAGLVNASGHRVTNRGLAKNSSWKSDRIAKINDQKYFRVATNEFVLASDTIN